MKKKASGFLAFLLALAASWGIWGTPSPTPLPTPTPVATATPTVAPTAEPTATPIPPTTPTPDATCSLVVMPDCGNSGCCTHGGVAFFDQELSLAQEFLRNESPELFKQDGSVNVSETIYVERLAKAVMKLNPGLCARAGTRQNDSISKDEIGVKSSNGVSQNVDVLISDGQPWVGVRYTCRPASF